MVAVMIAIVWSRLDFHFLDFREMHICCRSGKVEVQQWRHGISWYVCF